jgi:hypothetical protein
MKPAEKLADFVGQALAAGRPRDEIAAVLRKAGWQDGEVARAMEAWADDTFSPPVPRPQSIVSARDVFFYGLLFVFLGTLVFMVNYFGMNLIDLWFTEAEPDTPLPFWVRGSFRWSIAVLIVVIPLFHWLALRERRQLAQDPSRKRSALRKWFCYITLFFAATGLVSDLTIVVYTFLDGDISTQFLLKAGLVLVTLTLVFIHYWREVDTPSSRNDLALYAISALGLVFMVIGFFIVGGPAQGRMERRDGERLEDLQLLSSCISDLDDAARAALPTLLSEPLPCFNSTRPPRRDPLSDQPYRFERLDALRFSVCATFEGLPDQGYGPDEGFDPKTGCLTTELVE